MDLILLIILALLTLAGVLLAALQFPGAWLILTAATGYDWYYDWGRFGWKLLVVLAVVALVAEVAEALAGAVVARKAGASRRASIGALLGGFLGMLFLTPVPVPVISTIVGGLLGCFLGALIGELTLHDNVAKGTKVGLFAAIGRILGMLIKVAAAFVIAGTVVTMAVRAVL